MDGLISIQECDLLYGYGLQHCFGEKGSLIYVRN
jgi:hypothetical protein